MDGWMGGWNEELCASIYVYIERDRERERESPLRYDKIREDEMRGSVCRSMVQGSR